MQDPTELLKERFPFLSIKDMSELLRSAKIVSLKDGDHLIELGQLSYKVALVMKGLMRNYLFTDKGIERTTIFRKKGQMIGAPACMFSDQPSTEFTQAIENTLLLVSDFNLFRSAAQRNRGLSKAYIKVLESFMIEDVDRIHDLITRTPEDRLIYFQNQNPDLVKRIRQKHIASYLGISHHSLSRLQARLAKPKVNLS